MTIKPSRSNFTLSPEAWDDLADEGEFYQLWFRQLADIQEVLNGHLDEAADGITCHEQAENLRSRLEPLLNGLCIIGRHLDALGWGPVSDPMEVTIP